MMNKLFLAIAAVAIVLSSFVLGGFLGRQSAQLRSEKTSHYLSMLNSISRNSTPVEISQQINAKRYDHAKCIADVSASFYYRELQACLAEDGCRAVIQDEVQKTAPELLANDKSKFTYYENMERCVFAKKE
jgi:hypothetical protein